MNSSNLDPDADRNAQHERWTRLVGGYTAFIAALLVATFAKSNDYPRSWIVISLLALSLPSLVALMLLDYTVRVVQGRRKSFFRGLAAALGFLPSLAAIAILIGHFSLIAAALFLLLTLFWSPANQRGSPPTCSRRKFSRCSPVCQPQLSDHGLEFLAGMQVGFDRATGHIRDIGRRWRNWFVSHQRLPRQAVNAPVQQGAARQES